MEYNNKSPKLSIASENSIKEDGTLTMDHDLLSGQIKIGGKKILLNDRFELQDVLGTGNFSTVYKSIDRLKSTPGSDHFVTIKVLKRRFKTNEDWMAFESELSKYHSLNHPNITRVSGLNQVGSTGFLYMEYQNGHSLGQSIRSAQEKQIPARQALEIVQQVGKALSHAHGQGLIHGDLKPANIFLSDNGDIKVMDFGLALTLRSIAKDKADAPQYGANNYSVSTASYASPELLDQKKPDPNDDVFALACITYELLTGQHPFGRVRATGAQEFGLKIKPNEVFTSAQWNILQKALAFDRNKRTATVKEFLAGLTASKSSKGLWASVAVGVIALAIGGGLFLMPQKPAFEEQPANTPQQASAAEIEPQPVASIEDTTPAESEPESFLLEDDRLAIITKKMKKEINNLAEQMKSESDPQAKSESQTPKPVDPAISKAASLMDAAQKQIAAQRLMLPAGNNALDTYREVLKLVPEHQGAKQGVQKIKSLYSEWSKQARNDGDIAKADDFAYRSALIEPQDTAYLQLRQRKIEAARVSAQKAAEKAARVSAQKAAEKAASKARRVAKAQKPAPKPAPPRARVTNVSHNLITDRESPQVNIQARISGTVNRVQVYVDSGNGFRAHKLYDDGTHGDKKSGDGEFNSILLLDNVQGETRYYVAALLDKGISISSPSNVKKETYLIKPAPGSFTPAVVINEFMASNDQTISDSLGGYDDWIELYNNSPKALDLSGFYLSNDTDKPKKWRFPNGSRIEANSYLVVWADRSSSATNMALNPPEIHTSFTLSRNKGEILLVGPDKNNNKIIDQIEFGSQREDRSLGRFPNGLGNFGTTQVRATPGRSNSRL